MPLADCLNCGTCEWCIERSIAYAESDHAGRPLLYCPPDADEARAVWRANCGPIALAALLGRPVMGVREFFPRFPKQPWTNPTHMKAALDLAGRRHRTTTTKVPLALWFIQWDGPWLAPGVPVTVAYRHTHWIAAARGLVYDANAGEWITRAEWEAEVVPHLLSYRQQATGWRVRTGIEVLPEANPDG